MQTSAETIWASAQQLLRTMLNTDIYNLWFAPLRASALENDLLTLEVANDFCEVWLKDNYLGLIRDVLAHVSGQTLKVKFHVSAHIAVPVPASETDKPATKEEREPPDRSNAARDLSFNPKNTFDTFVVGNN